MGKVGFSVLDYRRIRTTDLVALSMVLVFLAFQCMAWPMRPGRDMMTYYLYYRDILRVDPEYPLLMLFRTPIVPIFFGALFDLGGYLLVHMSLCTGYVVVSFVTYRLCARVRPWAGLLAVMLIGVNAEYFRSFHAVASESVTSILLMIWFGYAIWSSRKAGVAFWVAHACIVFILVLTRPAHQVLVLAGVSALIPMAFAKGIRFRNALVFVMVYACLHVGYCSYNLARYGAFKIALLGPAHLPFYRLFITEKIIRPQNGPASSELAEIVEKRVISHPVFREYGVDSDTFFRLGSVRSYYNLVNAVNEEFGIYADTAILKKVSVEAHNRFPFEFWAGYVDSVVRAFEGGRLPSIRPRNRMQADYDAEVSRLYEGYAREGLEIPSERDIVPGFLWALGFQAEGYRASAKTVLGLRNKAAEWRWQVPEPAQWARRTSLVLGRVRPPAWLLVLIGVLGNCVVGRRSRCKSLNVMFSVAMLTLLVSLMANPEVAFRYPYDPLIAVFAVTGLVRIVGSVRPAACPGDTDRNSGGAMKVCFVYLPGRQERFGDAMSGRIPTEFFYGAVEMKQGGCDVTVLDVFEHPRGAAWRLLNRFVKPRCLPVKTYFGVIESTGRMLGELARHDVVVATTPGIAFSLGIWRLLGRMRVPVVGIHCGVLNYASNRIRDGISRRILAGQYVQLFGDGELEPMKKHFWLPDCRIEVNHFGIDQNFWRPAQEEGARGYALSVGNDANRDYELLADVAEAMPDRRFIVVTDRTIERELPPNFELRSGSWRSSDISDSNLRDLYRGADCVVLALKPSFQPSGQSVALQAAACGAPVVVSDTDGLWDSERIRSASNTMVLVEQGSVGAMVEAINNLSRDIAGRQSVIDSQLAYVHEHCGIEHFAARLQDACQRARSDGVERI